MASAGGGGGRGRRKQAKPQRKVEVNLEPLFQPSSTESSAVSPTNSIFEESNSSPNRPDENILDNNNIIEAPDFQKLNELVEAAIEATKTSKSISNEEEDKIKEYLERNDTAVIYPEPVDPTQNVPSLSNGVAKENEELPANGEYFKCPHCQKGCQTFQALKEHLEAAHPDAAVPEGGPAPTSASPAPFACSQCTASFTSKDQLEKHELLHSPNAQVSCKICNKTFANVYRLQRHMISHDESAVLRKFKCTECDKAFKFKHHLKEHIRIHSGEKPFECGNCGKRFSHSGSYSSHMTSKKCLVMNLKLGRTRAPNANPLLDKSLQNSRAAKRVQPNALNNNISTSPNHNNYLPILPKYTEAAAAFLASNPAIHPFYIPPPGMLNATGHPMSPYSMPNLGHLLEQLQNSPHRPPQIEPEHHNNEEIKKENYTPPPAEVKTETDVLNKSNSSSCGDLVMDEEDRPSSPVIKEEPNKSTEDVNKNNGDLEAVTRILETVSATVTKQLLQANMQKSTNENSNDAPSVTSAMSPSNHSHIDYVCNNCKKVFSNQSGLDDHECDHIDVKSEGLAAKLEDALTTKSDEIGNGSVSGNDEDYDRMHEKHDDYDMDCESTDQMSEDGRKVRVRSLISDEQLKVLKDYYAKNPRPKREELAKIAEKIGFQVRVVQVWFQNTRARDRREGRMIQVPFNAPPLPLRFNQPFVPSNPTYLGHKSYPLASSPTQYSSEQPLDLSTKKESHSNESSPSSSPRRPSSIHHSDSGEEAVNLSHKSSRSPTPFQHTPYHYQNSNCSSETRRTPSPAQLDFNNGSRLAQILAQPAHKLALPGMGLVPMDHLMQFGAPDLTSLTQLISNRMSGLSPNSEKRSWSDVCETSPDGEDEVARRNKVTQLMKSLGSPMLNTQDTETEGQFTCDQCDKAFSKQSSLARHKYEHSGQRPHKCDECPKAFKHKHHLTEHKRLHSGEKPFQCGKCFKRFSHSGSYSQHMNHRYSYCKPYRE